MGEEHTEWVKEATSKPNKHNHYDAIWLLTFFLHFFSLACVTLETLIPLQDPLSEVFFARSSLHLPSQPSLSTLYPAVILHFSHYAVFSYNQTKSSSPSRSHFSNISQQALQSQLFSKKTISTFPRRSNTLSDLFFLLKIFPFPSSFFFISFGPSLHLHPQEFFIPMLSFPLSYLPLRGQQCSARL